MILGSVSLSSSPCMFMSIAVLIASTGTCTWINKLLADDGDIWAQQLSLTMTLFSFAIFFLFVYPRITRIYRAVVLHAPLVRVLASRCSPSSILPVGHMYAVVDFYCFVGE